MLYFSRWQTATVLGITAFLCLAALPNVLPARAFDYLPQWAQRTVPLGIDLAGGTHAVLAVDSDYIKRERIDTARHEARQVLREARVAHTGLKVRDDGVETQLLDRATMPRALQRLRRALPTFQVDSDDTIIRLKLDETALRDFVSAGRRASMRMTEERFRAAGVEGATSALGDDLIIVDISDPAALERLASMRF